MPRVKQYLSQYHTYHIYHDLKNKFQAKNNILLEE